MHKHSDACLGRNELNEVVCGQLAGDRLRDADRWVVELYDGVYATKHLVFTDCESDAIALARANGNESDSVVDAYPDPQPDPHDMHAW